MRTLIQDIRYGMRMLLKNPAMTTVAALTLALGIGANTTIFSAVNGLMLRPLPVANADRLVVFDGQAQGAPTLSASFLFLTSRTFAARPTDFLTFLDTPSAWPAWSMRAKLSPSFTAM